MKIANCCLDNRIVEIDIAKGICILLMVIGHSGITGAFHNMINAFHMPFFFFVSGVTTNIERPFDFYLRSKVKGLIIPFSIYYIIHVPCYALVYNRNVLEQVSYEFSSRIDGALWFVPILFFAQIINWVIPRKRFWEFISVVILASISSILCIAGVSLPWNLSVLGLASSFVIAGRMLSAGGAKKLTSSQYNSYKILGGFIICFLVLIRISGIFHLVMVFDLIEPCLPIMVGAFSGIFMVLLASVLIKRKICLLSNFLSYTGINTFVFIGFSEFILKYENLYIREFVLIKYVLLFFFLYTIIYLKNKMPWAKALRL